jgi:hypothetical protein
VHARSCTTRRKGSRYDTHKHRSLTWQVDSECAEAMRVRERLHQVEQVTEQVLCAMVLLLFIFCITRVERGGWRWGQEERGRRSPNLHTHLLLQASRAIQEKAAAVELQGRQQQMREEKARWHSIAIHPTHSSYIRTTHAAITHRTCDMSAQMPCASQLT